MFILNKKTGVIQECRNKDVINACKKDAAGYAVADSKDALKIPDVSDIHASQDPDLESGEEEPKEDGDNPSDDEEDAGEEDAKEDPEEMTQEYLEKQSVVDLRKIAKDKKIQGYGNMDKATLIAVILAH